MPQSIRHSHRMDLLESMVLRVSDAFMALWPRAAPSAALLERARIVSHRGAFNNGSTWENTFAAFDRVVEAGVWGIEFDVRWTRDLLPVVFHDADFTRLGGDAVPLHHITFQELRRRWPQVPTLGEITDRFGGSVHLMAELKGGYCPEPQRQSEALAEAFGGLRPVEDFHLLSLTPDVFGLIGFTQPGACLPIARTDIAGFSRLADDYGYGGVCGHYLVMRRQWIQHHHQQSKGVGTGFSNSRNCLYREIGRGVDWVFSDRAVEMQRLLPRGAVR